MDRIALDHLDLWLDHLAGAALQTLHEPASLDSFEAALGASPPWPTPGATVRIAMNTSPGGDRYELDRAANLNQWLHAISIHELQTRFAGHSLWWRQTEATQRASVDAVRGLPDAATFSALLGGG